jgi:predicted Zn-dependent protease
LCGRLGEKVCGESVSIWDDGLDERGLRRSFDFEGVPKRRVELITNGVAAGLVYDSFTAGRDPDGDKTSTGHAGPAPNPWGPMPSNLLVACGDADLAQMIAPVERGLLVTRFHYTNVLHPKQSVLTGMTRDGTFLIEGGEIVGGVKNLRFTQSILEALSNVEMIGARGKLTGHIWTPAMKICDFKFTGGTEF